jgi:hypothetical protein
MERGNHRLKRSCAHVASTRRELVGLRIACVGRDLILSTDNLHLFTTLSSRRRQECKIKIWRRYVREREAHVEAYESERND